MVTVKYLITYLILIGLLSSCSSTKQFNGGLIQKRKYTKGFHINNKKSVQARNSIKEEIPQIANKTKKQEIEFNRMNTPEIKDVSKAISDSIKIVLKNGETFVGVKTDETEKGIVITLESGRAVYFKNDEIESITNVSGNEKLKNPHLQSTIENENSDDYAIPGNSKSNFQESADWENKKLPTISKVAVILGAIAVLLGIIAAVYIVNPAAFFILYAIVALVYSIGLYIAGLVLAIIGHKIAKKKSSRYDVQRARKLLLIFLVPGSIAFAVLVFLYSKI